MNFFYNNPELFSDLIEELAGNSKLYKVEIEKDYYLFLILHELIKLNGDFVFKGGTSLSKAHHAIERFSEDVDLSFPYHLGDAKRKGLKYKVIKTASDITGIPITNFDSTKGGLDVNQYHFKYNPLFFDYELSIEPFVRIEVSLMIPAFPYQKMIVQSYLGKYLESKEETKALLDEYPELKAFEINVQSLERVFLDKLFASADYYLIKKDERFSRHLYDLYMIYDRVNFNDDFISLFKEVKALRSNRVLCLSAKEGVNLFNVINEFLDNDYYKNDYENITTYLIYSPITPTYEEIKDKMKEIVKRLELLLNPSSR